MSDLKAIQEAIEKSNSAFEAFKQSNDARLEKIEKGDGGQSFDTAKMAKAFEDVVAGQAELKKLVEDIEAKAKRPGFSGGADDKDALQAEHKQVFDGYLRKGRDFDASIEQKALGISTNSGADGGYALPKAIDGQIESQLINISPIRQLATVVQVSTSDYHKLVNLRGTASGWVGEVATRPATNTPTLADVKPTMGELYANPQATQQMLDDVFFNAESWLADEVAVEFARAEGAAFVSGNGTDKPTGFLTPTYAATDDGARANGQLQYVPTGVAGGWAASNPADIFFTLAGKLKQGYREGAAWVMAKSILFEVAGFKDSGGRYIFNPVQSPTIPASILGWSVVEAEDMPAKAANALGVVFGNFKRGYLIADRIGTRVIRDPFSNKPYIGFYTTKRVGGIVVNSEALKAVKFSVS